MTQIQEQQHFDFEAEPRVVKSGIRYKQQSSESKSIQTFNNLMKEKKIRLLDPVSQEQEYVRLEKERIKIENMHSQLTNFKRNKKRMTPYEIKPSANPRIQVNLEFFLTDSANTIERTASTVDTQTDMFHERPASPAYVPKKTGIDAATQVEDYELFNFDREVVPILDVIVSKTLEEACLEIEEEQELLSMKRFKEAFDQRRKHENQKQKEVVQHESDQIAKKNEILKKYIERNDKKNYTVMKAQAYELAGRYLRDLQKNTFTEIIHQGFYPDQFQNQLQTSFLDKLIQRTQQEAVKIFDVKQKLRGTFDNENIQPIQAARQPIDEIVQKKKHHQQRRNLNYGSDVRVIRLVYQDSVNYPTNIAQKINKLIDGTLEEWEKTYEARMTELDAKLESDQMNEEEYLNIKRTEFPDTPPNYMGISVKNIAKLSFAFAHNQYYQTSDKERKLQPFAIVIDKNGAFKVIDSQNRRDGKIIRFKDNYRLKSQKVSDDIGIIIHLEKLSVDIVSIIFGLRLPNLQQNSQPQAQADFLANARFSIYDNYNFIPFDQTPLIGTYKFEELVKQFDQPEQAELPQTSMVFCYTLTKRFKQFGYWFLESAKFASKGLLQEEIPQFYQKVASFASEQHDNTLTNDKEVVDRLLEREKDAEGGTLSQQEQNSIMSKRRLPQSKSNMSIINQTINSKEASVLEPPKTVAEEPQETPLSLNYSRITGALKVSLNQTFEQTESQIMSFLTEQESSLIDSFKWGFEIHCRQKPFVRQKQLLRVRTMEQLQMIRKPEPAPEKVELVDQEQQDGDLKDKSVIDD